MTAWALTSVAKFPAFLAPLALLVSTASVHAAPRVTTAPKVSKGQPPTASTSAAHKAMVKAPRYHIAVQFVRTANDDGSESSTLTKTQAEASLKTLNEVWARNGGDIRFHLHPASNFDGVIESTLLNQDCSWEPGWDAAKVAQQTNPDLDPETMCAKEEHSTARNAYGLARANRVIVFSRGGSEYLKFDTDVGHWIVANATGGASSYASYFIRMPKSFSGSNLLAHEMGHYMHAAHTFGSTVGTVADARAKIETWAAANPGKNPIDVFDADSRVEWAVHDTPADPGTGIFKTVHGDHCDPAKGTVTVPNVTIAGKKKTLVLAPDRANIMSYFKGCSFDHHLSKGQWAQIHAALQTGNRKELVTARRSSCYDAGWQPGPPVDTQAKLIAQLRKIANCIKLQKEPLPWETVMDHGIYVNPATDMRQGVRKIGNLGVDVGAEKAFVDQAVQVPMEE